MKHRKDYLMINMRKFIMITIINNFLLIIMGEDLED
jgi:hypothetical protein